MRNISYTKLATVIGVAALMLWLFLGIARPDFAFNEDLGRHIAMGEMIWTTGHIPQTNLFTYTHPAFPFLDHHWLGQVLFFLMQGALGATSITLLKLFCILGALLFVILTAVRLAGLPAALASGALFLPLFFERASDRPEMFGYFFLGLLIFLFFSGAPRAKLWQWLAPFVMLLWINIHISFVFGALVIGAWMLAEVWHVLRKKLSRKDLVRPLLLAGTSALAVFINPHGAAGAFYSFSIFSNYGYRIVENQNIFFLIPRIIDPVLSYFSYAVLPLVLVFLIVLGVRFAKKKIDTGNFSPNRVALVAVGAISLGLAVWALRNFPNAALAGIPALALLIAAAFPSLRNKLEPGRTSLGTAVAFGVILIALGASFSIAATRPVNITSVESYEPAADFLLAHNLPGRIFNNFDIGGYLDYRLYPRYQTFVDNRPEAFPADFFKTYIAAQEDPKVRNEIFAKYGIHTVIFSVNDLTPWAQEFLASITKDPAWTTVYNDGAVIILTDRTGI